MKRRAALAGGLCLCCLPALAHAAVAAAVVSEVAPGLFVRVGLTEDASAPNNDAIANTCFIVGHDSVAVFDPGGSLADGEALRLAVRARTSLPVRFVILSHVHPDHIFGTGAFLADRPAIVGHHNLPAALAARGSFYQQGLDRILGPGRAGPVPLPTLLVRADTRIDLGGRPLLLTAQKPAHTEADLSAFDEASGTLLAGDLLFVDRVPSLDGDLKSWLSVLAALKTGPWRQAVPGHGPALVAWPAAAAALERYLNALLTQTRAAVAKGVPIDQAAHTVAQDQRGRWRLFDDYNPRNVIEAYRQLEWE